VIGTPSSAAAGDAGRRKPGTLLQQESADRLPEAQPQCHPLINRAVQQPAGFVGHAESAGPERLIDVLGGRPSQCDLEIVNDRGTVGGDGRDESATHQIDEQRPQTGLDDMRPKSPDDTVVPARGANQRINHSAEVSGGEDIR